MTGAFAIKPPAALGFAMPPMGELSTRPPHSVPACEYAPEIAATIAERRAFNAGMVTRGAMTEAEAAAAIALLEDLALDLAEPARCPRADRAFDWAAKVAELRRIITRRRKPAAGVVPAGANSQPAGADGPRNIPAATVGVDGPRNIQRIEALEGLHWAMTAELAWCDAFDHIENPVERRVAIRSWCWAIAERQRQAAAAGEPWSRAIPDCEALDRAELEAALALGVAVAAAEAA